MDIFFFIETGQTERLITQLINCRRWHCRRRRQRLGLGGLGVRVVMVEVAPTWGCKWDVDAEGDDDEEAMGQRSCRHRRRSGHSHASSTPPDITGITHYSSQSSHLLPDIYWDSYEWSCCTSGSGDVSTRTAAKPIHGFLALS